MANGGETVTNGTESTQGIVTYSTESEFSNQLVNEQVSGSCQIVSESIGTISYATVITIGTRTVFVTSQNTDPIGAITTFQFTSTRPVLEGDTL